MYHYMYIKLRSKTLRFLFHILLLGRAAFKSTPLLRCGRDPRMHIRLERRSANESLVRSQTVNRLIVRKSWCVKSWCVEETWSASRFRKVVAAGQAPPVRVKTRGTNDACSSSRTRWPFSVFLLLLAAVDIFEGALVRTGEGAKNPFVKKCSFKPTPKESACSDVEPRLMITVSGSAAKFKLLTGDWNEGRLNSHLGTNITEWVRQDVTHLIVPGDCEATCWTLKGMGCVKMGSTTASRGRVGDFPTIAERYSVPEGSLAEVKAMFCDWQCVEPTRKSPSPLLIPQFVFLVEATGLQHTDPRRKGLQIGGLHANSSGLQLLLFLCNTFEGRLLLHDESSQLGCDCDWYAILLLSQTLNAW